MDRQAYEKSKVWSHLNVTNCRITSKYLPCSAMQTKSAAIQHPIVLSIANEQYHRREAGKKACAKQKPLWRSTDCTSLLPPILLNKHKVSLEVYLRNKRGKLANVFPPHLYDSLKSGKAQGQARDCPDFSDDAIASRR